MFHLVGLYKRLQIFSYFLEKQRYIYQQDIVALLVPYHPCANLTIRQNPPIWKPTLYIAMTVEQLILNRNCEKVELFQNDSFLVLTAFAWRILEYF